ncbi:hypothetical protein [Chitinophaga tropicalis]|uniref:Uncharacterized protein n=1 Tax=Chitinophaga tropicalis TaxID=2683588 RepID=A0A7K1UCP8_9BACT|nr:hypothetical protein [Chitinophaga tropicalis]MVT12050.1 hypothetical protein [Chitinophaga tropicalis]
MTFRVLVKISKRLVSFWYQTNSNAYAPLIIKDSNEVQLYFYVNGNDFIFGNAARDLFNQHHPNAYGNYFEIIKDPAKHFTIYGNKKPVKQLFYYGIEQCLSFFINTVLYKSDSIESYRQHFALHFLFDVDIEDKEKTLIESLFIDAGYFNTSRVNYDAALFEVLVKHIVINPHNNNVLLLNGLNGTLYFKLFDNFRQAPVNTLSMNGQGADPRVKLLAEMIIEYIITQQPFLSVDLEKETGAILPFCTEKLNHLTPLIQGEVELTDGNKYWFVVKERSLNERLQYYSNDQAIYTSINDLLAGNKLNVDNTVILLVGEEISTAYFLNKLLKRYPHVKIVEPVWLKDTMELIFFGLARKISTPPPPLPSVKPALPPINRLPVTDVRTPPLPPPLPPSKK